MRRLLVIGIGAGDPEHITVQAIGSLNEVQVFFVLDKGEQKSALADLRREICRRYVMNHSYRIVEAPDVVRDPNIPSYSSRVTAWHDDRATIYENLIRSELADGQTGGLLVWGDPSLYDSTLRILELVVARKSFDLSYEVIPGITSVQTLAAKHRLVLNRIGGAFQVTTGRRVVQHGLPEGVDDFVVMLDGECAFNSVDEEVEIYWGAYLGTNDEVLISGKLPEVKKEIERVRSEARAKHGWIMDTYLLRRPNGA